jgi:hypothetical protein
MWGGSIRSQGFPQAFSFAKVTNISVCRAAAISDINQLFNLPISTEAFQQLLVLAQDLCHTRFSEENRMHLICVPGSQFHTYDRLMSVISQDIAQNVRKRFINFYYTHEGRLEGLYTNNDNYEDETPSSSSTGI